MVILDPKQPLQVQQPFVLGFRVLERLVLCRIDLSFFHNLFRTLESSQIAMTSSNTVLPMVPSPLFQVFSRPGLPWFNLIFLQ